MAQTFCTGPVHVTLGFGATGAGLPTVARYYGTTREGPDITEEPSYFNVMNDLAGPNLPIDRGYAGSEHTVALVMTRWDGPTDLAMDKYPAAGIGGGIGTGAGGVIGSEGPLDRGALVSAGNGIQLQMTNSSTNAAKGYRRYFQTVNIGPNKPIDGLKENIRVRVFKAQNIFIPTTTPFNNAAQTMFRLFDQGAGTGPIPFTIT